MNKSDLHRIIKEEIQKTLKETYPEGSAKNTLTRGIKYKIDKLCTELEYEQLIKLDQNIASFLPDNTSITKTSPETISALVNALPKKI
jgi:hypothetical protein